jgi:hypothetical protein
MATETARMLQYIAGRGGGPLVRLWQVRPPPSPALPLRTAFLRRFCRTHGRAPYSYFQPLILSRPTQTIIVCATSVATHALARTRAHAQTQILTVQVSVQKWSCTVTCLSRMSAPGSNSSRFAMAWPWRIFGLQTDCMTRQRPWTRRTICTSHADAGLSPSKNAPAHHATRGVPRHAEEP